MSWGTGEMNSMFCIHFHSPKASCIYGNASNAWRIPRYHTWKHCVRERSLYGQGGGWGYWGKQENFDPTIFKTEKYSTPPVEIQKYSYYLFTLSLISIIFLLPNLKQCCVFSCPTIFSSALIWTFNNGWILTTMFTSSFASYKYFSYITLQTNSPHASPRAWKSWQLGFVTRPVSVHYGEQHDKHLSFLDCTCLPGPRSVSVSLPAQGCTVALLYQAVPTVHQVLAIHKSRRSQNRSKVSRGHF